MGGIFSLSPLFEQELDSGQDHTDIITHDFVQNTQQKSTTLPNVKVTILNFIFSFSSPPLSARMTNNIRGLRNIPRHSHTYVSQVQIDGAAS